MPDTSANRRSAEAGSRIAAIERIISRDPANRNIAALVQPGHLEAAAARRQAPG